jgi:hypothetical protein
MEQRHLTLTRRDAVAALLNGVSAAGATTVNADIVVIAEAVNDRRNPGYRESESVRTYYAVNRT